MTDLVTLLTFPSISDGFTSLRTTIHDEPSTSSLPLRKVARLDADLDSGSASRSRSGKEPAQLSAAARGPVRINVTGDLPRPRTQQQVDETLALLRRCTRIILTRDASDALPLTYERIFALCRDAVVVHDKGEALAGIVKIELDQCGRHLQRSIQDDISEGVGFAAPFADALTRFEEQIGLLEDVLTYLDRGYLIQTKEGKGIQQQAKDLLMTRIFNEARIQERLGEVAREWLAWEWENGDEHENRPYIRTLIRHLRLHAQYNIRFEKQYFAFLSEHYTEEAAKRSRPSDDPLAFLVYCASRTQEEDLRARDVLPDTSWSTVQATTEKSLLLDHLDWLANGAIGPLLEKNDVEQVKTLVTFFTRVSGLNSLVDAFKTYVARKIGEIVCDAAKDEEMVERLLAFRSSTTDTLAKAQDAFASGFKKRRSKPAEMIARYIDKLMRAGQGSTSDERFAAQLDAALALYRFTPDKDRLLLGRSASDDAERAMLKKLKEEYDPEFGMGDHMFTDLALSRDTMTEYHKRIGAERAAAQKLTAMVLQQSFWPFSSREKQATIIPAPMQTELDGFSAFYGEKHQGHKIEWNHALGTVSLRARFAAAQKELSVSLYQAVVLLLFNDADDLPFADVKLHTGIEDAELRRTLQSLACGKKKVLKKRPVGKDVNDGDVFVFNDAFEDPRAKVHINSIQVKETAEESQRMQSAVEGDRKHYLDAAIVRVMKARKQLTYEQIKTETIEAVRRHFVPDVASIKQRVDALVEQEYLRRDDNDRNLFYYVA
ncbi:Cullin family-domain-containing protein [Gloeopeniophorella convolvens]|nr:Cullin family-domain-containing protein [Gloeopeniophorella convolvens]